MIKKSDRIGILENRLMESDYFVNRDRHLFLVF